jgi:hypothetical protein
MSRLGDLRVVVEPNMGDVVLPRIDWHPWCPNPDCYRGMIVAPEPDEYGDPIPLGRCPDPFHEREVAS